MTDQAGGLLSSRHTQWSVMQAAKGMFTNSLRYYEEMLEYEENEKQDVETVTVETKHSLSVGKKMFAVHCMGGGTMRLVGPFLQLLMGSFHWVAFILEQRAL